MNRFHPLRQLKLLATITVLVPALALHADTSGDLSKTDGHARKRVTNLFYHTTQIEKPVNYKIQPPQKILFHGKGVQLQLYARRFSQGEPVYFEILPDQPTSENYEVIFVYNHAKIPLSRRKWGYRGLFAIAPQQKPGFVTLRLIAGKKGNYASQSYRFRIQETDFPVSKIALNLGSMSAKPDQEMIAFIKECRIKKQEAFSVRGEDRLTAHLSHPRDMHHVTSAFFAKRLITRYKYKGRKRVYLKPSVNYHSGLDLRGITGEPIYAMADGRVVLSEKMHYEGNFTLIDHGQGIFTGYMHQNSIAIHTGDIVHSGQLIGTVGATGAVTGSHLHISLYIHNVTVNPISLLSLPIRD